jgi:hypothetical protein
VAGQPTVTETNNLLAPVTAFFNGFSVYRANGVGTTTGTRVLYWAESWWTKPTFDANHKPLTKGFFNTDPLIIAAASSTSTAGSATGGLPPQLACVVSWRTATSGRSGRGRTYLGNLGGAAQSGGVILAAAVTSINTASTTLISAVHAISAGGGLADLGVWSPTKGVVRPVLSGAADSTWDTMRSRVK